MVRPKHRKLVLLTCAIVLALCLLLTTLLLSFDYDSLASLQKTIHEDGSCTVSAGALEFVIQADIAEIKDDTLVLRKSGTTGDDALVLVRANSRSVRARSVSLRFLSSPKDVLELSLHDTEPHGLGVACFKLDRRWGLRQWFQHFRSKARKIIQ